MKQKLLISLVISIAFSFKGLHAQQQYLTAQPATITRSQLFVSLKQAEFSFPGMMQQGTSRKITPRLRNTGIVVTSAGIAFIIAGALMANSAGSHLGYYTESDQYGRTTRKGNLTGAFGIAGMVGGTVAVLGGATMWILGSHKLKKNKVGVNVSGRAAGLVYKF